MAFLELTIRQLTRFGRFFRARRQKAWSGVSILIFREDSAGHPERWRINFYILFFFGVLIISIPLLALGLSLERQFIRENPASILENRHLLLNTFLSAKDSKKQLLHHVSEQVTRFRSISGYSDPKQLSDYIARRIELGEVKTNTITDRITQEVADLANIRLYSSIINEASYYSLNQLWHRIFLHHIMPRNRPLLPGEGRITSLYGNRPNPFGVMDGSGGKKGEFHSGLDLAAIEGEPIIATAPGLVIKARHEASDDGYGRYVKIHHGLGYYTIYAHCTDVMVNTGEVVERGEIIGTVGKSGRATGSHLHYEVRLGDRKTLDPIDFVRLK